MISTVIKQRCLTSPLLSYIYTFQRLCLLTILLYASPLVTLLRLPNYAHGWDPLGPTAPVGSDPNCRRLALTFPNDRLPAPLLAAQTAGSEHESDIKAYYRALPGLYPSAQREFTGCSAQRVFTDCSAQRVFTFQYFARFERAMPHNVPQYVKKEKENIAHMTARKRCSFHQRNGLDVLCAAQAT